MDDALLASSSYHSHITCLALSRIIDWPAGCMTFPPPHPQACSIETSQMTGINLPADKSVITGYNFFSHGMNRNRLSNRLPSPTRVLGMGLFHIQEFFYHFSMFKPQYLGSPIVSTYQFPPLPLSANKLYIRAFSASSSAN